MSSCYVHVKKSLSNSPWESCSKKETFNWILKEELKKSTNYQELVMDLFCGRCCIYIVL